MIPATGWLRIGPDPAIAAWAAAAHPVAVAALQNAPRRAGGTWSVGVDALLNGPDGAVGGVAFPWGALPLAPVPLHRAQLSTLWPGYPQSDGDDAAHRWRLNRDGAHLDGLIAGPDKRRRIEEPHAWILGLPITACGAGAAPLVIREGSHEVIRQGLLEALEGTDPAHWPQADLTDAYAAARRRVLAECPRVELPARPGQATLIHRLAIHGVASWTPGAHTPPEGRIIAYLRPLLPSVQDWLRLP
ncbi:MAG TPA: hypothetical protein VLA78_12235 [Paracoccaceae bacterium]|nr:hypothetical protein [Paracoccaceae bacterium]